VDPLFGRQLGAGQDEQSVPAPHGVVPRHEPGPQIVVVRDCQAIQPDFDGGLDVPRDEGFGAWAEHLFTDRMRMEICPDPKHVRPA
jgi:hypothetical protein